VPGKEGCVKKTPSLLNKNDQVEKGTRPSKRTACFAMEKQNCPMREKRREESTFRRMRQELEEGTLLRQWESDSRGVLLFPEMCVSGCKTRRTDMKEDTRLGRNGGGGIRLTRAHRDGD